MKRRSQHSAKTDPKHAAAQAGAPDSSTVPATAQTTAQATAEALLQVVGEVVRELHPHKPAAEAVGFDQSLDQDLGFDSLGRVELLFRIEQALGVSLSDQVLASAETPRDLLRAVMSAEAPGEQGTEAAIASLRLEDTGAVPRSATTLTEVLAWHCAEHPQRPHVTFYADKGEPSQLTYGDLLQKAEQVAAGLQALDLRPGQPVAIMLPTGEEYFYAFHGTLLAGGIPTPIYPPFRPSQIEDHLRRHSGILANAQAPILITLPEAQQVAAWLQGQVGTLRHVISVEELAGGGGSFSRPALNAGDIALLQYTSGSTGNPKGVVLTHENLLANIRAMGTAMEVSSTDVFVSWLPLYHDMGLIGACLGTLYHAVPLVLMAPLAFMARPERWLWAIHRHRGTLSAGVNFAYELCLQKIPDSRLEGLDLSSLRATLNGAEPISPDTLLRFNERFADYGLRPEAHAPVYGLAECAVGLAFPTLGRAPVIDSVERDALLRSGRARPAAAGKAEAMRFVACGQPLPGHEMRLVDESGHEVGERRVGRLQFKGPSATSGYYRNAEATAELFKGDWLDTGDRAYFADGDIYLTSRVKDIIIRGGRNLHPYELEDAAGGLPGVRSGCVAVFGSSDPASGTERLIVVAETREREEERRREIIGEIERLALELMGTSADHIVLAPPHSVLKTSSGKIRRAAVRELYERGAIGRRNRGRWGTLAQYAWAGLGPRLRRGWRFTAERCYAAYAFLVLLVLSCVAWPIVVLCPRPAWSWPVVRTLARLFLALMGIPLRVRGLEHLPRNEPCVVLCNHSSYSDVLVLAAALPINPCYVAKQELAGYFIPRLFLRALGARFVERFDVQQGVEDSRRIAQAVRGKQPLLFFPEGTFTRIAGLRPFHLGAFMAAAEGGVPVVPITVRGTRTLLRGDQWLPRRTPVGVSISPPIAPEGEDWAAAVRLRDAARAEILRLCGEPDLARHG